MLYCQIGMVLVYMLDYAWSLTLSMLMYANAQESSKVLGLIFHFGRKKKTSFFLDIQRDYLL